MTLDEIINNPKTRIYGLSIRDILKMSRWLANNNVTVNNLDDCKLDFKGWARERIFDSLMDEKGD